jgi:hypothetical protein
MSVDPRDHDVDPLSQLAGDERSDAAGGNGMLSKAFA